MYTRTHHRNRARYEGMEMLRRSGAAGTHRTPVRDPKVARRKAREEARQARYAQD